MEQVQAGAGSGCVNLYHSILQESDRCAEIKKRDSEIAALFRRRGHRGRLSAKKCRILARLRRERNALSKFTLEELAYFTQNSDQPDRGPKSSAIQFMRRMVNFARDIKTPTEYRALLTYIGSLKQPGRFTNYSFLASLIQECSKLPMPEEIAAPIFAKYSHIRSVEELTLTEFQKILSKYLKEPKVPVEEIFVRMLAKFLADRVTTPAEFKAFHESTCGFSMLFGYACELYRRMPNEVIFPYIEEEQEQSFRSVGDLKRFGELFSKVIKGSDLYSFDPLLTCQIIRIVSNDSGLRRVDYTFQQKLLQAALALYGRGLDIHDLKILLKALAPLAKAQPVIEEIEKRRVNVHPTSLELAQVLIDELMLLLTREGLKLKEVLKLVCPMFSYTDTRYVEPTKNCFFVLETMTEPRGLGFGVYNALYTLKPTECVKILEIASQDERLILLKALLYHIKLGFYTDREKPALQYLDEVLKRVPLNATEKEEVAEMKRKILIK
ncbi:MAG: hypothetical protein MRY21_01775 [Simkaniaceae bacterium]|nr:hypothetical protein [Simkaniaceae bacterium]